jgi:hypothetical protein
MKKIAMLCLFVLIGVNVFAQNKFEKGYFINNDGEKIECFIQNDDWRSNPTYFKYKNNLDSKILTTNSTNVKEFKIGNATKYKRFTVEIDRSSKKTSHLSTKRTSVFKEETLFLKAVVEGSKASLYSYVDVDLYRYFYTTPNKTAKQLIYKLYRTSKGNLGINDLYKKQLKDNFSCSNNTKPPSYHRNSLKYYFINFNNCEAIDTELIDYTLLGTKSKLRLKVKGGINYSKVDITPLNTSFSTITSTSDYKISPRFGLEMEYLLPTNNNRWGFFIEPTYQSFEGVTLGQTRGLLSAPDYNVDYKSIELPVGVRYYFPIKNSSDLFINGGIMLDFPLDSTVGSLEVRTDTNLFLGFGYEFKNKYSIELRYNSGRNLLTNFISFDTSYTGFAFNFGYTLF